MTSSDKDMAIVTPALIYTVDGRVATIRLNRPGALNALSSELLVELKVAFENAARDENVRAIVLTGEGRAFSSGADLMAVQSYPPLDSHAQIDLGQMLATYYNPLVLTMRAVPKPIVAAVNGIAAGAGASLALLADITIASRSAAFLEAFVNIGLVADCGGSWALVRALGPQRAAGLMLLGEKLSAETAKDWGLIWDVVDDDQLDHNAQAIAAKLAAGPGMAIERIKRLINGALVNTLPAQLELEAELQRECGRSADFVEGAKAFVQKRKPVFTNQ